MSPKLTLLGRSALLAISEVAANAVCWVVAGLLFGRNHNTQPILSLALLAWTLGLRHALDADHISAIDNATRGLINLGQLPVTCGLFFSLGHSTIVIVVTVAIAISSDVFNKLENVGEIGGIVGAAVSGSFLFIVGLANSIILWRIFRYRQQETLRLEKLAKGETVESLPNQNHNTLMLRILGPIMTFVDRPWKMYPVGVLFGFGFDTASSIALLALSAIAKRGSDGKALPSSHVVILPLLFTAGMSMVDSADSILMLYSYSGFPSSWALFKKTTRTTKKTEAETEGNEQKLGVSLNGPSSLEAVTAEGEERRHVMPPLDAEIPSEVSITILNQEATSATRAPQDTVVAAATSKSPLSSTPVATAGTEGDMKHDTNNLQLLDSKLDRDARIKMNTMSGLSIVLTLMSILTAFSISLITIMGLIGEQCGSCQRAADAPDGEGGLAGQWWRGWAKANDNSGYIGAAIVGTFLGIVGVWYGGGWVIKKGYTGRGL